MCCSDALFETIFKYLGYFRQHTVLRMTRDRQHKPANSNIISDAGLLYTCYVQLQYYINN